VNGHCQKLEDLEEFTAKIKAAKDAQRDPDFCVIARLEGLVLGRRFEEVLERADAYHAAGADALMIHTARREPDEILKFARLWGRRCPVVIAPTTYGVTSAELERAGVSLVIWANHCLRASIRAMQQICSRVHHERSVANLEDVIVPLEEVFRLQNMPELLAAQSIYFSGLDAFKQVKLGSKSGDHGVSESQAPRAAADSPLKTVLTDSESLPRQHSRRLTTPAAGLDIRSTEQRTDILDKEE
jgi:phosphoenolpyruvate phosphomutase